MGVSWFEEGGSDGNVGEEANGKGNISEVITGVTDGRD